MPYSQNNEEQIILEFFGDKSDGRFLDIGAYNGVDFSNTLALVERGWSGVCIEPSPAPFVGLMARHGGNRKVDLVQTAVVPDEGEPFLTFHDSGGDAVSTLDEAHRKKWEAGYSSKFVPFHVRPIALATIFEKFGLDFDFVNLDVEGTNWPLFTRLPLGSMPKLRLLCVEHDTHDGDMERMAANFGFRRVSTNAENVLLGR